MDYIEVLQKTNKGTKVESLQIERESNSAVHRNAVKFVMPLKRFRRKQQCSGRQNERKEALCC